MDDNAKGEVISLSDTRPWPPKFIIERKYDDVTAKKGHPAANFVHSEDSDDDEEIEPDEADDVEAGGASEQ